MITLNDVLWSNDNDGEDIGNEAGISAQNFNVMTIEMCCWGVTQGPNVGWPTCGGFGFY